MVSGRRALAVFVVTPVAARAQRKPAALEPTKQPAPPPPPKSAAARQGFGLAAPVPNRSLEGPVVIAPEEGPTLEPSIIQRRLPGRGVAAEGAVSRTEERLFDPAPGARLTVPFKY